VLDRLVGKAAHPACYPVVLMGTRTRIRGKGTVQWPGNELDGAKVFIIGTAHDGQLIVRTRTPGADTIGKLARIPPDRVAIEPP
jgi:hypothetical protein